jgi:glycosyltransferase involved in cell wall biosynthesis
MAIARAAGICESKTVKVSALITTFNHERFVAEAIEGFLMQEVAFPCELIIADDASTDATRDVIRRYWERHQDRIRVLLNRRNIGVRRTFARAYDACRGQYVASLDGDDYWISPHKLQRQADLLDDHPDYALCFHSAKMVWDDGSREPRLYRPPRIQQAYGLEDLLEHNFIAACSPMYRRTMLSDCPSWHFLMPIRDWTQHVLHARHGAIGYIDEPMGVYRQHSGGVYSTSAATDRMRIAIDMLRRFRCVMARRYRGAINHSLCRHYCGLAREYCDEGKLVEARRCLKECIHEISPTIQLPIRELSGVLFRSFAPSLHRWCR